MCLLPFDMIWNVLTMVNCRAVLEATSITAYKAYCSRPIQHAGFMKYTLGSSVKQIFRLEAGQEKCVTYQFQTCAPQHMQLHRFDNQNNVICETSLFQAVEKIKMDESRNYQ